MSPCWPSRRPAPWSRPASTIRHPLYSSLLILAWGVFFKDPSWLGGLLALAATLALIATAKADEAECTRFFGFAYQDYMRQTRMFVPFLF